MIDRYPLEDHIDSPLSHMISMIPMVYIIYIIVLFSIRYIFINN